jgi:hypothetical protein
VPSSRENDAAIRSLEIALELAARRSHLHVELLQV